MLKLANHNPFYRMAKSRSDLTVRVKEGMSLRNGIWHGLRNDITMRNLIYRKWRKQIN